MSVGVLLETFKRGEETAQAGGAGLQAGPWRRWGLPPCQGCGAQQWVEAFPELFVNTPAKKRVWWVELEIELTRKCFLPKPGLCLVQGSCFQLLLKHQPLVRARRYQLGETSGPWKIPDGAQTNVATLSGCSISPKPDSKFLGMYHPDPVLAPTRGRHQSAVGEVCSEW